MNTAVRKPITVSADDDVSLHIETVTGQLVNPTNPDPVTINIQDIAWALSRIPRFAGHTITATPYNVAQHSIYVSNVLEGLIKGEILFKDIEGINVIEINTLLNNISNVPEFLLKGLMHDAHEAYTGDIPSPLKRIPELRETLKIIEMRLDHAIKMTFGISETSDEEKKIIKIADNLAQAIEAYQFMPSRGKQWDLPVPSLTLLQSFPPPLSPIESYKIFMHRFSELYYQ